MERPKPNSRRSGLALAGFIAAGAALVGCASPDIDYTARIPAGADVVAEYRSVAIDRFSGPESSFFESAFSRMVSDAELDGLPWFEVTTSYDRPEAVFRGYTDIDWIDEEHERNIVSQCVEWDGPFDCETRADFVEHCVRFTVSVTSTPELIDLGTGRTVWRDSYSGDADDRTCEILGRVDKVGDSGPAHGSRNRHGWSGGYGRYYGGYVIDELVREALAETLSAIRRDIAPYNSTATARLIDKAVDPEVRADPRFEYAVKAVKDDRFDEGCAVFAELANAYPSAPDVKFNMGACAEANGDYGGAQALYAEAVQSGVAMPDIVAQALKRINSRRAGEREIESMIEGPSEPQPSPEASGS